jgi:Domain of unknown function (DUF4214)
MATVDYTNQIEKLYIAYFGRPGDPAGVAYWNADANANGGNLDSLYANFALQPEYVTLHAGQSPTALVNSLYVSLFGHSADVAGLNYWVGQLTGGYPIGKIAAAIVGGAATADAAILSNKAAAATIFTTNLDTSAEVIGYDGPVAFNSARTFLSTVTSTAATAAQVDAAILTATTTTPVGQTYTLLATQDIFNGGSGADVLRGVAGVVVGGQDQSTLNSSDILDGGAGQDLLAINMTGANYLGGATIKNIETLQIGTNLAAANFDYNVNAGTYEVTGVDTVVFDQITTGEILTVNNITPTSTTSTTPTLTWANENGSRAGAVAVTYRAASTTGTNNQNVVLQNVNSMQAVGTDGQLNIAGGIETITINSAGTVSNNTLSNSANLDGAVAADVVSTGTLTKVVLTGSVAIGKAGTLITDAAGLRQAAGQGLLDHINANDMGLTADSITNATEANLLSVSPRVTEVDASAMTGAANVRFMAKADGTATNVTFKGGSAGDYAEFELGNVTATGNDGADTFAFITQAAGVTNSTYGAGDTITGGTGSDTLQLGLNGVGTYTLSTTEFSNTTGIDVLNLLGATNTVTVSSTLVSGADAGKFEIHTDRIVQTSATDAANPTGGMFNAREDNSVNTINLTNLTTAQGVVFAGGSGSDRLVLNNASFNQNMVLTGGTNVGTGGAAATTGDYDTLTVIDNAVIDRTDLANVSGFEGMVLTESGTGNSNFSIELTTAIVVANTQATDLVTTDIDDRYFQIGTASAANANNLEAGDIVTIDISSLFIAGVVDPALGARRVDTSSLTAAGVTVNYVVNGAAATVGQIAAVIAVDPTGNGMNVINSAANVVPNQGVTYTSGIGAQNELGTNFNDTFTLSQADTVTGGTGNDTVTFNAGSTAAQVTLGAGADTANLNVIPTAAFILNMAAGGTVNVGTNLGVFDMNGVAGNFVFGAATTVNVTTAQAGLTIENGPTVSTTATAGGVFTLGTGGQTFSGSGALLTYNVTGGTGADSITYTGTGATTTIGGLGIDTITLNAANVAVDVVGFNDGGAGTGIVAAADRDVITGFAINDVIQLDTAQLTVAYAGVQNVSTNAAVITGTGFSSVLTLNFDLGGAATVINAATSTDGSAILANMAGAITLTALDTGYIVAYDAGNAYLYAYNNAVGTTLTAGEIALVGTFNGVAVGAPLGSANFTAAA